MRFSIIGLFAVLIIGMITHATAEPDKWTIQYSELKDIYDQERWNLEKKFIKKFEESSQYYTEQKQTIYEKFASDSTLGENESNDILSNLFFEFVKRQEDIKVEFNSQLEALDAMFKKKFEQIDREFIIMNSSMINMPPNNVLTQNDSSIQITSLPISPLEQLKAGESPFQIKCKLDYFLVHKYDGTPSCVKHETKIKLIERGWSLPNMQLQ